MEIHLLGPLVVRVGGREVDITSQRAKGLLAILIVAPNHKMHHSEIVTRLWPGERVDGARVRDARRDLDDRLPQVKPRNDNRQCIITLDGWAVDYLRFTSGVTDAKRLAGRERVEKLQTVLAEWRAEPLVDADFEKFDLSRERAILDDRRRSATVDLLEAMFECGELRGFRMAAYDALRRWPHDVQLLTLTSDVLAETESGAWVSSFLAGHIREHGDPYGRLMGIQSRFGPAVASVTPGVAVPRQLPGRHRQLVGRRRERQVMTELLADAGPGATRIVMVSGMAGVGKTSLACSWAEEFEDRFPGGTLYADLNGLGPLRPEEPEQILTRMLKDLDVEPAMATLDGLIAAFRSATAGRSVLVVLDNARDSAQARPLLPGTGCPVVVTSRVRLESLVNREGAHPLTVRPLDRPEAAAMLAGSLGEARMRQAGHLADEIAGLVGGLPLALAVIAARVAVRPAEAVRAIRDALRETKTRLNTLSHPQDTDLDVRVALSYSKDGLSEAAVNLWALLALHPGPTISLAAVVDLAGYDCGSEVAELVAAHLLEEPVYERYAMHDLVRDYGIELAGQLPPGRAEEVTATAFEFLLQHVWACDLALVPGRDLPIPVPISEVSEAPRTVQDAMTWLDDEYPTVTAALRKAAEVGAHRYTWLLAMALLTYQWRRSKFADADRYLRAAADAAERVASLPDQAMVYRMLAGSRWNMKKYTLAEAAQRRAVAFSERAGDLRGVAYGHVGLAALHLNQHEYTQAGAEYGEARALFEQLGDDLGEADALSGLAQVALAEGDHDRAVRSCLEARDRYELSDDLNGQAAILVVLGEVHKDRGDLSRAAATYDLAISHYRSLTRHSHEARTLIQLARALQLDGRTTESRQALRSAHALYRDLGDETGLAQVEELLGDV
ncbi:AfsR/SARP family transcriptional regulator [Amycolatopsis cihanbeyliensis]|uniref:AAA ATPase-like protein n=1 Tax=Amycolatopsis cihanbeyliensis TaxID=1128664 RepID=A0A542CV04_AMYCI|nr:tetratricopeptide repeat protein [Amycolatopsis cihanbeyliensis]TQI94646.1 AAA ATPase-like protein [Amycolatopsis cihanbeyliensis]